MKREKNEFLGLLCNLYLIALLVALPLYTGEGYWKLGDTKYVLFRNVSYLCLGCWLVLGIPERIRTVHKKGVGLMQRRRPAFSIVDCAVAAYGGCVVVSAWCSSYGQLAWAGYNEWYMGASSQLMFVGIYFFVSRQYDGSAYPLYLGEGAFFLVTLLGLMHRLGIDPLGLQTGWNSEDWEYNHMLSTLGNINWLCGFYSVALAWLLTHFMRERKRWLQVLLYIAVVTAFVLLGIQGSQGGLLILVVGVVVCIWLGWREGIFLRKLALLSAGFFVCMPLIDWLTKLRGKKAAVAADGDVFGRTVWYEWGMAALFCVIVYFFLKRGVLQSVGVFCKRRELHGTKFMIERKAKWKKGEDGHRAEGDQETTGKSRSWRFPVIWGIIGFAAICCIVYGYGRSGRSLLGLDDNFGSGRGFLWRIAAEGFAQAGWKDKLLGAGPDCYGEAIFNRLGAGTDVWNGEHWEGAIFTNAHNEVLSQLINVGILGTLSYLAIFLTGLWRYGGLREQSGPFAYARWLGVLTIAMYGAHSLISFQQVLNAPLLFLTLGLCEYGMRCREEAYQSQ